MEYKKLLKCGLALLLCVTFIISISQIQGISAIFDPIVPIEDDSTDREEKIAIYWNPESGTAMDSNASRPTDQATDSNASESVDLATRSIAIKTTNLANRSNVYRNSNLASDSDAADGLTPDTAVENLNVAIKQAEKLSRQLRIEMSDIVIYAMNPMYILPETSYAVDGKGVTVVPWGERVYDEGYIFIVEGGQLTLDNIKICPHNVVAEPEESSLVYMSSGIIQLGEEVESYGTFVLDYTQMMSTHEPLIELMNHFDFATKYRLDLRFPKGMEQEVTVINSLSPDNIPADVFKNAFSVADIENKWELFVEEQSPRVRRDTVNAHNVSSNTSKLTQKSLVARRGANVNELFPDPTNPKNHVLTISKTVVGTQADKEKYFQFMIGLPSVYNAYVLDSYNKVVTSEMNCSNGNLYKDTNNFEYIRCEFWEYVFLKDGQKLVFTDIPAGIRYSAVEFTKDDTIDKTSVKVVANGKKQLELTQENAEYLLIEPQMIGEYENSVAFTNTNSSSLVNITVSKQVEGDYANRTRQFSFKIYLRDSNGKALASGTQLSYRGSVIAKSGAEIPDDGILTLDQEGSATFELKNGQRIKITSVPPGQVRIHETENPGYITSYWEGNPDAPKPRSDTQWVELVKESTFHFTNRWKEVVPTGVMIRKDSRMFLLILSMLMLAGMTSVAQIHYRRIRW